MNSSTPQHRHTARSFWTAQRLTVTFIALALVATFGVTSCTQPESTSTNTGNGSAPPTNTTATGNAPVGTSQPPAGNNTAAPPTNSAQPPNPNAPLPTVALPASLFQTQVKTIDGKTLKLADYKGKVLVINYWASWCGPCRVETPELLLMSKEYKSRGVEFIGLTTKQNDPDIEPIKEFVSEQRVTYPIIYDDGSLSEPLTQAVRARPVIPQSFVITREGGIYKHFSGFSLEQTPRMLREAIEQAANAKS